VVEKSIYPDYGSTILLVEDEDAHAALIRRLFEKDSSKWDLYHVNTLNDALKWIEDRRYDFPFLVIADYLLPDGNGLDLTKGLENPSQMAFPLIILTGFGSEKLAVQAFKSGAMDYVVKDADGLKMLPNIAHHVLRKWDNINKCKLAEDELDTYIRSLEEEDYKLDDLVDKISEDLEASFASVRTYTDILLDKYIDVFDEKDLADLVEMKHSVERTNNLVKSLLERLLPLSFDISLVKLYSTKVQKTKETTSKEQYIS